METKGYSAGGCVATQTHAVEPTFIGEAWLTENGTVVIATHIGLNLTEAHNCDEMGCSQWHVVARFRADARLRESLVDRRR